MSTVTQIDPSPEAVAETLSSIQKPKPLSSLQASGARLKSKKVNRAAAKGAGWQEDAWDAYDLVGEERFLATTLANRISQARFFVGKIPTDTTEDLDKVTEGPAHDLFDTMVGKGSHFTQMMARMGLNLFIAGDGYLVGVPSFERVAEQRSLADGISPFGEAGDDGDPLDGVDVEDLTWMMMSLDEFKHDENAGTVEFTDQQGRKRELREDEVIAIRVWRSHPRKWWDADSPTRSSLPVLRELIGLTMHISAQLDSRLAGAGVFFVPSSADQALRASVNGGDESDVSPFADALMDAMAKAVSDRSSPEAMIPIMPVVPDESIEKFRYVSFASPLDAEARSLRDEAIRRLALGQDCPPELLLGVAGMNHWGAWLVREDVVTTHLEPPLALICDAVTTQFLWPALEQQGMSAEEAQQFVIWYDVDHLVMRPNRAQDASAGHAAGVISDEAYRDALGFDESDAPDFDPSDEVNKLILDMIREAPTLVQNPGLPILAEQVRALVEGRDIPEAEPAPAEEPPAPETGEEPAEEEPSTEGGTPDTDGDEAQPSVTASSVPREFCGYGRFHKPHLADDGASECPGKIGHPPKEGTA